MRNRGLHDALRSFALEAAAMLSDDLAAGQEIEFDLEAGHTGRGGPSLYHFRSLTGRYIEERWNRLRFLPSAEVACAELEGSAAAYLRLNGLRGAESEPALRAMLERLYEDLSDFSFPEERFERVYREVEGTLYERSQAATVLVPVRGLEMDDDRVDLGDGLTLVRGDRTDAPDEAVWGDPSDPMAATEPGEPNTLLMLERDVAPDDAAAMTDAGQRFRELLFGLRLYKAGGVALAPVAWRRTGDGRWQPFELESTGDARGAPWILVEGEGPQLTGFLDAIADPPAAPGALRWALARFQMGCGRRQEAEALTDYLLALRALIDEGEASLALRVAVLCAEESDRRGVQRRIELAQALERMVIGDGADDSYLDTVGADSPATLVAECENHLRALLRDVLCGYLNADLPRVADDLLLDHREPFEIRAASLKPEPEPVVEEPQRVTVFARRGRPIDPDAIEGEQLGLEDPECWSAPV